MKILVILIYKIQTSRGRERDKERSDWVFSSSYPFPPKAHRHFSSPFLYKWVNADCRTKMQKHLSVQLFCQCHNSREANPMTQISSLFTAKTRQFIPDGLEGMGTDARQIHSQKFISEGFILDHSLTQDLCWYSITTENRQNNSSTFVLGCQCQ